MARWPGARWRPLPEQGTQRRIKPTQLVLHSAVGRGSVWGYFAKGSVVVESTFWIGLDGRAEQYMDSAEKAEAQALGNPRAISVETADNGHPDEFPWTAAQIETLAQLAAWCHREHGIPLRLCPSWDSPGIGYHRQYKQWNPNTHSCPGTARIRQVPQIIARAKQIVAGGAHPKIEEDDVTPDDIEKVADRVVAKLLSAHLALGPGNQAAAARLQGGGRRDLTVNDAIVSAGLRAFDAAAGVAAVGGALKGIADTGADQAALVAAARTGAAQALSDIRLVSATDGPDGVKAG